MHCNRNGASDRYRPDHASIRQAILNLDLIRRTDGGDAELQEHLEIAFRRFHADAVSIGQSQYAGDLARWLASRIETPESEIAPIAKSALIGNRVTVVLGCIQRVAARCRAAQGGADSNRQKRRQAFSNERRRKGDVNATLREFRPRGRQGGRC